MTQCPVLLNVSVGPIGSAILSPLKDHNASKISTYDCLWKRVVPQTHSKNHLSQASSLGSSVSTNQSRAPLERGGAVLNRAPTPSTVITPAPPTLKTSAGDSHREHADGRHDRCKRSAKQKKWHFWMYHRTLMTIFRLGIYTMPKPKRHR